jgi:hypothetical protein
MPRAKKTTTTTKTATTKAATVEVKTETPVVEEAVDEVVAAPVVETKGTKKTKAKHDADEAILCRSVCQGELVYQSKKTGVLYTWANYGDEIHIEYQDLLPLILTKSGFVMKPLFVIEDADLVAEYPELEKLYTKALGYDDMDMILLLDNASFQKKLLDAPVGIRESIKVAVATRIEEGTFDSLQKIKLVDQILGSDLMCLIQG